MRLQRKSFAALHSRLSKYWDEYVAGTRSAHRPIRLAIVSLYHNKRSRILHQRHFGTEVSYGHFGTSAEVSGHFGTSAEVSYGHFGTSAEMS